MNPPTFVRQTYELVSNANNSLEKDLKKSSYQRQLRDFIRKRRPSLTYLASTEIFSTFYLAPISNPGLGDCVDQLDQKTHDP